MQISGILQVYLRHCSYFSIASVLQFVLVFQNQILFYASSSTSYWFFDPALWLGTCWTWKFIQVESIDECQLYILQQSWSESLIISFTTNSNNNSLFLSSSSILSSSLFWGCLYSWGRLKFLSCFPLCGRLHF